jgi:hypothetical protein
MFKVLNSKTNAVKPVSTSVPSNTATLDPSVNIDDNLFEITKSISKCSSVSFEMSKIFFIEIISKLIDLVTKIQLLYTDNSTTELINSLRNIINDKTTVYFLTSKNIVSDLDKIKDTFTKLKNNMQISYYINIILTKIKKKYYDLNNLFICIDNSLILCKKIYNAFKRIQDALTARVSLIK